MWSNPVFWAIVTCVLGIIINLIIVVKSYTTMGNKVEFLSQLQATAAADRKVAFDEIKQMHQTAVTKFEGMHAEHYRHAATPDIHQLALSKETTMAYLEAAARETQHIGAAAAKSADFVCELIAKHAEHDDKMIEGIRAEIRGIHLLQKEIGAIGD